MRLLRRNTTVFEYLPYDGTETDLNDDGEHTGEFPPAYGAAVQYRGNISTPTGHTAHTYYGTDIRYTHILVMDDTEAEINEHGIVIWKGNMYEVTDVRQSLNALSVALRRMTGDETANVQPGPEGVTGETGSEGPEGVTGETGGEEPTGETGDEPDGDGD